MKRIVHPVYLLACISLVLLTSIRDSAEDASRESQEDDIREAVLLHQFEHNASGQQQKAHGYYIAIGDKHADPSDAFIRRFAHHKPPVRKASACRVSSTGEIVSKWTGRPGLLFVVGEITWISDSEVKVYGGYDEANLSSSRNTYTVKKQNGK